VQKNLFKTLYESCQTLGSNIPNATTVAKVKSLTGTTTLPILKTELDVSIIRGYFLAFDNSNHPFFKLYGKNIIVIAKTLNPCWKRFVILKESMHLLDDANERANSAIKFRKLLNEWGASSYALTHSPQIVSDYRAISMALACVCSEDSRLELQSLRNKKQIDDYGIARQLQIPEHYVPLLFDLNYTSTLTKLLP
jgi:hypothetical protein